MRPELSGESPNDVLNYARDVVVIVVMRQRTAERYRANGKYCASARTVEIDHIGTDQVFVALAADRRVIGEHFFGHQLKMALRGFRCRKDYRIRRRA